MQEARDWYNRRQVGLGLKFLGRVSESLDRLGQIPKLFGTVWKAVRASPIRQFPHIIYYRVHPNQVEVLAVLHGSQDLTIMKRRV